VQQRRTERGVSLTELLTIVAIIGVIALITVPALVQLMPQYRIRSAASDASASLRMLRQKAISTRTPWRISFDDTNDRYAYSVLNAPNANRAVATNWRNVGRDFQILAPSRGVQWIRTSAVALNTATTNSFKDVDCDGNKDIIFLRDGSVADNQNCSAGAFLTFGTRPSMVFTVDNTLVKFNRYYLSLDRNGKLTIQPTKE